MLSLDNVEIVYEIAYFGYFERKEKNKILVIYSNGFELSEFLKTCKRQHQEH